jgi:succinate dehydrogenase / fumarate reductase iron-sulfur subunit
MKITFKVFRFDKDSDYLPYYGTFELEVSKDDVMLDVLNTIKWDHDGSLSYRRSCRHGICGSCGIKVNDQAVLACKQNVFELVDIYGSELKIDPQSQKESIKDLVVEKKEFWEKHEKAIPYLVSKYIEHPESENIMSPEEVEDLEDADYCIQCGNCHYACPVIEVNEDYLGPATFTKAFRFAKDPRGSLKHKRLEIVNELGSGIWDCVKCYMCAEVCPKEINPIDKIIKLHQKTFKENMQNDDVAVRHAVGFKHSIKKHGILDEGELVRYSEGNIGVLKHIPEAIHMYKKSKIIMPWNMPKSQNLDEIQRLVASCEKDNK